MLKEQVKTWTTDDAAELYDVGRWGAGYFSVGAKGNLLVHPDKDRDHAIDLAELVDRVQKRGVELPVLLRFADVLKHRLTEIHDAFGRAIVEHKYQGRYCCVYPIKVNQQRQVVEEVVRFGEPYQFGLEVGSRPELLAVIAIADNTTPIICNGFKDAEFIELAMWARKIGRQITVVVEKLSELKLIVDYANRLNVRPTIGIRVKLASPGAGRWQQSGGYRSKFGLTVAELLEATEFLESHAMSDCFQLLHFHLGSQVTDIRPIKTALVEAARIYVELVRRGTGLRAIDVGGGLGVDYDGSKSNYESSINYTLQEYANDVVYHIQSTCDDAGVEHPTIVSESGRAAVAYHSVLVFGVVGVTELGTLDIPTELDEEVKQPIRDLLETFESITPHNLLESYHDAQQSLEMAMQLFTGGYLPIEQRSIAERLYWAILRRVRQLTDELEHVSDDLAELDKRLADTYFCNFSLFQSMPDSWAIRQLFPVMPIHRLEEQPTREAVLGDITCDSDGKLDQFVDRRGARCTLPLHQYDGQPYYLGAFLVGAYQEILGDLHNLFGDTNAVHVGSDVSGRATIETVVKGDSVDEVLHYVQFDSNQLIGQMINAVEHAVREGRLDDSQAGAMLATYERSLGGYTYMGIEQTSSTSNLQQPCLPHAASSST
ncbi:MAG: biosynthetic arginine decarboxylase [Pirellulales bacterium]|nr:biosynthetic arginine decarboxylase [Pirellulales bacterium]